MSRKKVMGLFVVLCLCLVIPARLARADFQLDVSGAVLIDANTGQVLFDQNAGQKWFPASVTKVMTLIIALEMVAQGQANLDDPVITSEYAAGMGGSQVWLESGETFSLEKMLIAIAVGSANDASVAVAEHLAGSEEAFVGLMNAKAKELGAKNTHFVNCHGLHDPEHYTCPYDTALFARYALHFPKMLELTSIKEYTFREKPKLVLWNTNKLLWWYPGTDGFKTGSTELAKYNLCSTVERNGLRLIAVVLGVEQPRGHFSESIKLYNYGFAQYVFKQFYAVGEKVCSIPVDKGMVERVEAVSPQKIGLAVRKGQEGTLATRVELHPSITAPLAKDEKIGEVVILQEGRELTRVPLVAAVAVPKCHLTKQIGRVWARSFIF